MTDSEKLERIKEIINARDYPETTLSAIVSVVFELDCEEE